MAWWQVAAPRTSAVIGSAGGRHCGSAVNGSAAPRTSAVNGSAGGRQLGSAVNGSAAPRTSVVNGSAGGRQLGFCSKWFCSATVACSKWFCRWSLLSFGGWPVSAGSQCGTRSIDEQQAVEVAQGGWRGVRVRPASAECETALERLAVAHWRLTVAV